MGAFNQLNGAIFDAAAIEARISAIDGRSIYNQRDGATLSMDSLARRLTALDGKVAVGQGGIEFDVDSFMRRLAAIEAGVFSIASLFAAGEQGGWYDPSDFSTMFQDTAGTTPVTAVGQSVARVNDKSGRGNTIIQATSGSRPILRQDGSGFWYWEIDGLDDAMATAAVVDYAGATKITICAAIRKEFDQAGSFLVEHGANGQTAGCFGADLNGIVSNGTKFSGALPGGANDGAVGSAAATTLGVFTMLGDAVGGVPTAAITLRKNGAVVSSAISTGTISGSLGSQTTYIGGRTANSLFLTGRIYQLVLRGAATSGAALTSLEQAVNAKCGAF